MVHTERARSWCCFGLESAIYFFAVGLRAAHRPLWYDEIVTWRLAELPSIAALWAALLAHVDQHMPLVHVAVRLSRKVFGTGPLATRLPMVVSFWAMLLALYVFLKRRLPWRYAMVGALFPAF